MRRRLGGGCLLAALLVCGQVADPPELKRAREEAERVRELVYAGALPRKALEEAQLVLAEAEDEAVLHRTLYGSMELQDLTEELTQEMLDAANRLVDRQQKQLAAAESLVRVGAAAKTGLAPYREELARRRTTVELANERAGLFRELVEMVRREAELERALREDPERAGDIAERFDGAGVFLRPQSGLIELEFQRRFRRPLPISADGDTALHRSMGFDHRGRLDVALHPDSAEGRWLRQYLQERGIPYFAFRGAVPGKATAAHIHIGPQSVRVGNHSN